jgi:hypothetical protein
MVGAINPNGTQTLDAQIRAARGADIRIAPGEAIPKEFASSVLSEDPALATSSRSHPSTDRLSPKLSSGAIAGVVVGSILSFIACAGVLVCVARSRRGRATGQPSETVSTAAWIPAHENAFYQRTLSPVSPENPQAYARYPIMSRSVFMAKIIHDYNC